MVEYTKDEARVWARTSFQGVATVTHPSYTADFAGINEAAVAFDVQRTKDFGFAGTLLVTELAITPEENALFTRVARETAGPDFGLFFHPTFSSLEENIEAARLAADAGADRILMAYPTTFWPTTEDEVFAYTKAFADATDLAIMLFPVPQWGFERIHPAGMSLGFIRRVLDEIPNVVAIKAEQGHPGIGGILDSYHHFRDEVVISVPLEADLIPLLSVIDIQFSGTSNANWMGDYYPRAFALARSGRWEEAMELYWQVQPARQAGNAIAGASSPGTTVINRTAWKYQEWLAGYNGGALRHPAPRIPDRLMKQARQGLAAAGLPVTDSPDAEFVAGRIRA